MKKILVLIIVIFFVKFSWAQGKPQITVFSEDGHLFWLIIDGKKINETPQYRVENVELPNDWARAKVIFKNDKLPMIDESVQGVDADGKPNHVTYKIMQKKNGKWTLRASSWEVSETEYKTVVNDTPTDEVTGNIEEEVDNNTNMDMNVDINDPGMNEEDVNIDIHVDVDGLNTTNKVKVDDKHNNIITPNPNQNEKKPDVNANVVPGYTGPYGCYQPMNAQTFANAKNSIASKDFEDSKLTIAKQIANTNCLLVSQVKEILMLFSFENSKLEFAKHAYTHTYDKGNYFMVNDVFDFSSSIDDLNEYISLH